MNTFHVHVAGARTAAWVYHDTAFQVFLFLFFVLSLLHFVWLCVVGHIETAASVVCCLHFFDGESRVLSDSTVQSRGVVLTAASACRAIEQHAVSKNAYKFYWSVGSFPELPRFAIGRLFLYNSSKESVFIGEQLCRGESVSKRDGLLRCPEPTRAVHTALRLLQRH